MRDTVAFVTSQYSGDRIIKAAHEIANSNNSKLTVVGIMDNQYEINPEAIDYLFKLSKEHNAVMQLIFREDSIAVMKEIIGQYTCQYVVSGMPSSNDSVLYDVWKRFPEKSFYTVDIESNIIEVATTRVSVTS